MTKHPEDGQLHTFGLLELRTGSKALWGASSDAYFRVGELLRELANPNLHDIPRKLPFRVDLWDRTDRHLRMVLAASSRIAVGHSPLDVAIANHPSERFSRKEGPEFTALSQ